MATVSGAADATTVTAGVDAAALDAYEADVAAVDGAGDIVVARAAPYYVEEDLADDEAFRAHTAGAAYNEWYRPHGLTDAVGLLVLGSPRHVPDLYARYDVPLVANVLLAGTPLSAGPEADRGRALLAVVHPALVAAVETLQRAGGAGTAVGAAVDGMDAAAWLYDGDGRRLHESDRKSVV